MAELTASDRAWLRDWDARFKAVEKVDLGQRGSRSDALGKVVAAFKGTPEYGTQARLAADLMAFHRDRLTGTPTFGTPGMGEVWAKAAAERAARLDAAMQEPDAT